MEKNLWDDIQIEVSAEFDKVKMTIGELKQITQGQIVDLGSVFNNEIFLYVEDKKVAKGELMIINDRYAVRLNEILNVNSSRTTAKEINTETSKKIEPSKVKNNASAQQKVRPEINEDEEFDYSDFEK